VGGSLLRTLGLATAGIALLAAATLASAFPGTALFRWAEIIALTPFGIAGWLGVLFRPNRTNPAALLGVVLLVAAATVSAAVSAYPSLSIPALWHLLILGGIALLVWRWTGQQPGRSQAAALAIMLLLVVLGTQLLQDFGYWLRWLALGAPLRELPLRPGIAGGLVGAPTWAGDYTVLLAPMACVMVWRGGRGARLAAIVLAGVAAFAVLAGGTRSLWLVALLVLGPIGIAWVVARQRERPDRRVLIALGIAAVAAVLLGLVAVRSGFGGQIIRDADEGRTAGYRAALAITAHHPLLGGGPGTYGEYRLGEPADDLGSVAFPNAHNIVLNTAAETGLVGLATFVAAGLLLAYTVRRSWRASPAERSLLVASVAGLAMLLLHALVDVVIDLPGIAIAAFIVTGIAIGSAAGVEVEASADSAGFADQKARPAWRAAAGVSRSAAVGALALAVLLVPSMARIESSVGEQRSAILALREGRAGDAAAHAQTARQVTPDMAPADRLLLLARATSGDLTGAIDAARAAATTEPMAQHRLVLGVLLARARNTTEGLGALEEASKLPPTDGLIALNTAVLAGSAGDSAAARDALVALIEAQPWIGLGAASLPATLTALLPAATAEAATALRQSGALDSALASELAIGDVAGARAVVAQIQVGDRPFYEALLTAWGGDPAAARAFEAAAIADPRGHDAVRWAWLLAANRCDRTAVTRWRELSGILTGGDLYVPIRLGQVPDVPSPGQLERYPRAMWHMEGPDQPFPDGTWVYQYGTPWGC
jgi:O-antigen ligase